MKILVSFFLLLIMPLPSGATDKTLSELQLLRQAAADRYYALSAMNTGFDSIKGISPSNNFNEQRKAALAYGQAHAEVQDLTILKMDTPQCQRFIQVDRDLHQKILQTFSKRVGRLPVGMNIMRHLEEARIRILAFQSAQFLQLAIQGAEGGVSSLSHLRSRCEFDDRYTWLEALIKRQGALNHFIQTEFGQEALDQPSELAKKMRSIRSSYGFVSAVKKAVLLIGTLEMTYFGLSGIGSASLALLGRAGFSIKAAHLTKSAILWPINGAFAFWGAREWTRHNDERNPLTQEIWTNTVMQAETLLEVDHDPKMYADILDFWHDRQSTEARELTAKAKEFIDRAVKKFGGYEAAQEHYRLKIIEIEQQIENLRSKK